MLAAQPHIGGSGGGSSGIGGGYLFGRWPNLVADTVAAVTG